MTKSAKSAPPANRLATKRPSLGFIKRPKPSFAFAEGIISEMKRVTWPSRQETNNLTRVVIAVSLVVGLLLGAVDLLFTWFINGLILR